MKNAIDGRTATPPGEPENGHDSHTAVPGGIAEYEVLPPSFSQERLWLVHQMDGGSTAYNIFRAFRLSGPLDVRRLERAFRGVIARHESLRTTFREQEGAPVQVISPHASFALEVEDAPGADDAAREAWLDRRLADEAARGFDLEAGPLFRAGLLRLGETEHVLRMGIHHIVSDGWSMDVLYRELSALYADGGARLEPLPLQYADYALWQREEMAGPALQTQRAYWRGHLAGAPALLELPADHARPAVQRYRGASVDVSVPGALTARLEKVARAEGATLYMVLMAAWQVLLARYSRATDIVTGTSVAGRPGKETEGLIGFFANTLALRTDLSGDPAFRQVLRQVRAATLGAFEHQQLPFERLVEELQPERALAYNPIFQVFFALQNAAQETPRLAGVSVEPVAARVGTAKFDLSLLLGRADDGLRGVIEYNSDLFEPATAARAAAHLLRLLEGVAADPAARVSALPLLPDDERATLLGWSGAGERFAVGDTLHGRFAARAAARPAAVAVTCGDDTLTYGELDARAARLARRLRALGVGPESRVGLCAERSLEMVVGIIAILKAGGAYVSLDPAHPPDRLAYMAADAQVRVLLAPPALMDRVQGEGLHAVSLEDADDDGAADDAGVDVDPRSLAYVIYTSGSTGRPKGVAVTHANVLRLFDSTAGQFGFGESDAWTLFHSFAFDFSVWEMWGALLYGGRLVVVPWGVSRDPAAFRRLLARERVTVLNQTPSAFRALARTDEEEARPLQALRYVIFGGEALQFESLRGWLDRYGPRRPRLVNMYGITETTVHVTWHTVTGAELRQGGAGSAVGTAIPDLRAYVLDEAGAPAPVGVPGELHVGGDGLARGYLGRPALTAQRFVPDPFSGDAGARLYRSGDLARWRADGTLEYLGRIDQQVKIRGFRIELGEIESLLLAHPGVASAAVVVRGHGDDAALAAYVVPNGELPATAELREALRRHLPEYMLPAAFVALDRIPLTANGKLDRAALPEPDAAAAGPESAYVAPRTPVEEVLAAIWAEVLGASCVGALDNFFEIGGHSLLAARAISRMREALGAELPLRALFDAPTVAGLAERVEALRGAGTPAPPPVTRAERDAAPLSFAQERLWFLDRMEPGSAVYNVPLALRLAGALDVAALERALGEIVRRHAVLRTTFQERGGAPVQAVAPFSGFTLERDDPGDAREDGVRRRLARESARPFDLAAGPVFRATLLRVGDEEHVLLLCTHHVATDGWSTGVLLRELAALYGAYLHGADSPLAEPPVQYADFAAWQREQLDGPVLEAQVAWWRARLAGAPALLPLPTDRPRPAAQSYRGGYAPLALPGELVERLRALARGEGATLYMVLLGAFQLLLSRYTGADDVVVGSPFAGRTQREVEGLIGFFVNPLVMRTDLAGDPAFRELLGRVREVTLGAWEHQHAPFEKLVEALQPERSLNHSPLFQAVFTLQDGDDASPALPGLRTEVMEPELGTSKFDLTLLLAPDGPGLRGGLGYSADLFDAATVQRMAGHLRHLLEQVAGAPDARLSAIEMATEEERRTVLETWGGAEAAYPAGATVHALFAEQAARTPHAVAVEAGDLRLTYAELDARAERLAAHLQSLGVGAEARVGICLERGPELVSAILAVLKAGGAYVPLDPGYPAERLAYLLSDSGVAALVTQASLLAALPVRDGLRVVTVEGDGDAIDAAVPSALPRPETGADALAYVMYTSGSTGTPKGVAVPHRAVVRLVRGAGFAAMGADEVVLHAAPVSFDAATLELWAPLLNGGRVVLMPGATPTLEALGGVLVRHGVTTLWLTAGLFQAMAQERLDDLAGVRQLLAGGDVLPPEQVRRVRERFPDLRLINGYGPTENTTFTCCYTVPAEWDGGPVPIGTPIGGTYVRVLDAALRPVPAGVPGELYAGGAGLARGYLNRAGLTAERFVPDPFPATPGARLYRTGDRARWRADGTLEFMGRLDQQVKLRGFRIEPGEVESALLRHADVRECAVMVREDAPGEKRLAAYVVGGADAEALRAHLRGLLPEYMVPAAFVPLDALPLSPNGKVDRAALPAPEAGSAGAYVAPRTPAEEALAAIWAEVLKQDRVGVGDGFFELGGHSLAATRVVSRVRQAFGVELPLRALFEAPTLAELAARVEALRRPEPAPAAPAPGAGPFPLSFAQERLWFLERLRPGSAVYNIPWALRLHGPLHAPALERALGELVRRHHSLRTTFHEGESGPVQQVAPFAGFALATDDLAALHADAREAEVARRVDEDAARPFDLAAGPPFRASLLRLGADEHVLLLCMHHAVSDGWSMGVLFHELGALYAAHRDGGDAGLADLPLQYAEYAARQREALRGEAMDREVAYWRARLAGAPALLELPADRPRPAVQSWRGATERVDLPPELLKRLQALGRTERATPFMVLLAAFQLLLSKYAATEDVVVGTPVAGRTTPEVEGLIGFFVNTLALRTDLSGDPGFRELVRRARDTALGAFEHQALPFEKLVEAVQPGRSLGHAPVFQVSFALHDAEGGPGSLPGLRGEIVNAAHPVTKFDLSVAFAVGDGFRMVLEYATDLFDRATILRMAGHLRRVLEQVAQAPDARASQVELPTPDERRAVLDEWNRDEVAVPAGACLHHGFETWAAEAPERRAVIAGDETATYGALNARANRLAHHLRARGVGPETRVGICLERGMEMVVALFAVLKAGGACVPLDPAYPAERLAYMLGDAEVKVLVTQESLRGLLPATAAAVVSVDGDAARIATAPALDPVAAVAPRNLAYLVYTSGSTGTPKGVAVEHAPAVALAAWAAGVWSEDELSGVLASTSISFDVSVAELFVPLALGGCVIVAENALELPRLAAAGQVRMVNTVPSAMAALLEGGGIPAGVTTANLAGEPLRAELADALYGAGIARVLDLYGPSEDTTYSTWAVRAPGGPATIGRPIAGTRAYVLDAALRPLPPGVPGELCLGGRGLARGYLGLPALTAERFVPDPFGAEPGRRLYRTGDRARWRADGTLEYLGRLDHQVKVRGFRVEPGEVEAALRRCPGVRDCAVMARPHAGGDVRLVAWVAGDAEPDALRTALRRTLPEHMVPAAFVAVDALPLTPNGKLDRRALPDPAPVGPGRRLEPETELETRLAALWGELLGAEAVGVEDNFFDLGGHSLLLARMQARLARELGLDRPLVELFQYPTIRSLAASLQGGGDDDAAARSGSARAGVRQAVLGRLPNGADRTGFEVAVVGMAGRFPGAEDIHAFWRNLRAGVESISFFTPEALVEAGNDPAVAAHPDLVPAMGWLRAADEVDATLFGLTPRDAEVLDPQHRLLLECAWAALEHAGCDPARTERPIGVFAGSHGNQYLRHVQADAALLEGVGRTRAALWNDRDQLATGVSYRLNLRGPSVAVGTACSTSLVAVHLACQSLVTGECDLALAGGVCVQVPLKRGYLYTPEGIGSPDGHVRAYDAQAKGTVGGSGAGLVALKRLDDALADGDTIHAVIRGSAINNDGAQKVGYTAPSVSGQARVISEALSVARVDASTLQYVEGHGSGTPMGDAIELRALAQVLGTGDGHPCAIGSVKASVGHLDTAAGVAGLIKTVLAISHREIPPSLNCAAPHPEIAAMGGRVAVATELTPWARNGTPRRAGVSSFGIGGTNAHVVLEEAPDRGASGPSRAEQLLVLSARTPTALAAAAEGLAAFLASTPPPLADAAFTLQTGRRELEHRLAVPCAGAAEAVSALRAAAARPSRPVPRTERPVAFLFPGLGMHHVDMGRGLYDAEPVFRAAVDECCERLRPIVGADLREALYPPASAAAEAVEGGAGKGGWDLRSMLRRDAAPAPAGPLDDTRLAQPAVFVVEYALARLWMAWGVMPRALLGHSLGEYVAACVAGVLTLEDALTLVALRARLIGALPAGAMLAVPLSEDALREVLPAELDLAAVNTRESCVVSGPVEAIEAFEAALAERGTVSRRLVAGHAFHSRQMAPVGAELERLVAGFTLRAPQIPFASNVTGTWITDDEACSPAYWARHLCGAVRFADGVAALRREPGWALLEVGPGQTLGAWALQHPDEGGDAARAVFSSLRHPHNRVGDLRFLLETLGGVWSAGVAVDWGAFSHGERRHRVPLPGYPFERRRYWVPAPRTAEPLNESVAASAARLSSDRHEQKGPGLMENGPAAAATDTAPSPRQRAVLGELRAITASLTGIDPSRVETDVDLFRAGFDSLLLLQGIQAIEKRMGVRLSLVETLEETGSLEALAQHIDRALPADAVVGDPEPAPAPVAAPAANGAAGGVLEQVVARQLEAMNQLMAQQLAAVGGHAAAAPEAIAPLPAFPANGNGAHAAVPPSARAKIQPPTFVAHQPVNTEAGGLTAQERAYLDDFIPRYVARTGASKAHQARYHAALADSRVTARFRRAWKEILYPIVGDRAAGARVWDVDGNEYVDTGMAFGCALFGHAPEFVSRAIQAQVERGYGVGPQSPDAGRAAELVCALGGNDRAVFCNSGTEAVMGAIRAARTFTGRSRVAYFAGAYHGWSDIVQGRVPATGDGRVRPTAPGIQALPLDEVVILDYDQPESIEKLAAQLHDVAVVMVEPVQSRRPDIQPRAFLHELRRITRDAGTLLLFDELVTGFRIGAGGAQAHFGVDADLVTYGKVVAGGLPMGVVAGRRDPMSVFDGGEWRYGDDSFPPGQRTLFAGAFFKHPISMAVTVAIMEEIRRLGPSHYDALNDRTTRLVGRMNAFFEGEGFPVTAASFGSVFRFFMGPEVRFPDLFSHHLILQGIHVIPETGTHFLSFAHGEAEVEAVFRGVCAAAREMRAGGFLPTPPGGGRMIAHPASGGGTTVPRREGIEVRGDGVRTVPLTEGQRQLWIESQMGDDANRAYVESTSIRLHGALDVEALRGALQALVDRHDTLRTTFGPDGEAQLVHPSLQVEVPLADFRGAAEREARVAEWIRRSVQRPFDLERGPLVRFHLAALGPEEHLLLFTTHHAVLDGWSFGVLFGELGALYTARREGRDAGLPPRRDHAERVLAQNAAVREDAAAQAWWEARFADGVPVLELPADRPRPATRGYRGARAERDLGADMTARLAAVAGPHGFTVFNVVLSALVAWLGRLGETDDVVVGTPAAGQAGSTPEEGLVGYGIQILPVRVKVDPSLSFVEHARRVRRAAMGALENRGFSFSRLVETLYPRRDPSRPPVFQVLMNLDRAGEGERLGDLRAELDGEFTGASKVDLAFDFAELGDALRLRCVYDTDLFDAGTVERWLDAFGLLLDQVARAPRAPLSTLELVGDQERRRLLDEWNPAPAEHPADRCIHRLFEEQAAETPDAAAVVHGSTFLSYAQLNARANQLARRLAALGVGPEARVGICMERGEGMVAAMLAVLKAGGAYVPLDPAYPAERLAYMAADAALCAVVTTDALRGAVPPGGAAVVSLDGDARAIAAGGTENLAADVGPDALANVIYTSGSTGEPKGVAVPHRGVVRLVRGADHAPLGPGDRVAQASSASFDAATFEVWGALLNGAALVVLDREVTESPARLAAEAASGNVTTLFLTTALLNGIARELPGAFRPLRRLLFGGEAVDPAAVRAVLAAGAPRHLLHVYGPTENTTFSTWHRVAEVPAGARTVPIGRAVARSTARVVDGGLRLVPAGVPGELCVGGDGLARGYLGRPAQTAERFVPDPFSARPGARMYRTGDRVRWAEGGALEFLGRADGQVKIRGFRIEPGEVEAALRRHPRVAECAVAVREDVPGSRRLAAYVVGGAAAAELREHLRATLPEYMLPAAFVPLASLPLTRNGKLDRAALPVPEYEAAAERYVAPRTPAEETLARIWAELLRVGRVGVEDSFFALGGDSILAIQVAARARQAGVPVTPRLIFEHQTVAGVAAALEGPARAPGASPLEEDGPSAGPAAVDAAARRWTAEDFPLAGIGAAELEAALEGMDGVDDLYPLSPLQEGMLFHALAGAGAQEYQVQLALRLDGALDADRFRRAWDAVVARHPALRTSFAWRGLARPLQRVHPSVEVPWAVEDWTALEDGEQEPALERWLAADRARGFALDRAPLMRCALFVVRGGAHWFTWSLHHALADGWSTSRVMAEVWHVYAASAEGGRVELAPVRPYRDFVAWLDGQDPDAAERYWRTVLAGFGAPTPLGVDRPAVPGAVARNARHRLALPAEASARLQEAARGLRVTLNTLLQGAWALLLARYAGEDDVVFGTTVAGRPAELEGAEEMVGMFINTLPVRVDAAGGHPLGAWLADLQRAQARSRQYEYAPLDRVQGWSEVPRGTPLFETLFVFENHLVQAGASGGADAGVRATRAVSVDWTTYPLCLTAHPGRELALDLAYDEARIDADAAERMLGHFVRLLGQLHGAADRPLAELALLDDDERRLVVEEWNRTERGFPRDALVHDLIAAQAARTPDAPAVLHDDLTLTFAELDARANRIAHHLLGLGVRTETRVAICVARGPDLGIAILGALRAGAAYVPLDPAHPDEHLSWLLQDSGAAVLLTHAALAERFAGAPLQVVALDGDAERIAAGAAEAPETDASAENLAYVIYTSGSTGRPKGVALQHRALVNFATDMAGRLEMGPGDRVLQFASPAFDVVVEELFPAWVSGAAVVFTAGNLFAPAELLDVVERHGVTTFELPTAYWHEWVHALVQEGRSLPLSIRVLMVGGERVAPERLAEWSTLGVPLVHVFGLTETACNSATLRLEAGDDGARWAGLPIGTPTGNTRIYLLDRRMHPAPVGVPGEAFIGGEGVARGYLGRPALTAERFVPDPFSDAPGSRMYRTGDAVRWLADGNLEFVGRLDHQVKLRGFRIEPGEVEAALQALPGVREARVVVREDRPGQPRLVAYLVGRAETDDVRAAVRRSLPEHMVPDAIVTLDRLPLTTNGKLDRAALPAPEGGTAEFDEPRSYLEAQLIQLWESVLGVTGIGATQSFFEVGGSSILALRLFTRVNRELGCDLPLSTLLTGATVRRMAQAIAEQQAAPQTGTAAVVPLQPGGGLPPLFLVHASDRNVMGYVNLVRHLGPDQPAFGIRDVGDDMARPLERIAADHIAAMRQIQPVGPYHLVGWSFGGLVVAEMGIQLQRIGERAAFIGLMDTMAPDLHQAWPWDRDADLAVTLARDVAARARRPFVLSTDELEGLDVEAQVARAVAALHAQNAAPPSFDGEVLLDQCRMVRDRDRSFAGYTPERFRGTLTLFRALEPGERQDEFLERYDDDERRTLGWCRHADEVQVFDVPGGHAVIGSEPHCRVLAECMRASLADARERSDTLPAGAGAAA